MLASKDDNLTVLQKTITGFFSDVNGLGPGNIKKIIMAGYDSVENNRDDHRRLFEDPGFKEKSATKLHTNISLK